MTDSPSCPHCLVPLELARASLPEIPSDILSTNWPPSEHEIVFIKNVLAEERTRKTRLDAQIVALQSALNRCIQDRRTLEADIQRHEGTLSPLRRMPPELLSLIFRFLSPPTHNVDPAPWTVSRVCRKWRGVVTSQPSFWASVVISIDSPPNAPIPTKFMIETQLQRSGKLPLNIVFDDGCGQYEWVPRIRDLLNVLASHSARWETIQMSGRLQLFLDLAPTIRGRLPLLKKMEIMVDSDTSAIQKMDAYELAPRLRDASVNLSGHPVAAVLPFSQLLQYVARNTWGGHLSSLRSASNLVECALELSEISTPPASPIALPHLVRLSLSNSIFLECLDTPKLRELYCISKSDHLSSLLQRHPYQLEKLVIFTPASLTDIAGALRAAPTITELGFAYPLEFMEDVMELFMIRNAPTDVGHNLRSLHIWWNHVGEEIDYVLSLCRI
ncbi:hypothetical protein B0H11DRAFT_2097326, partial [Mycena galericulata]